MSGRLNVAASAIFFLAVVHTFAVGWFARLSRQYPRNSIAAELLHLLSEVEVVFGLWAIPLLAVFGMHAGWAEARHYVNDLVNYTEPLFVVVIMTMASTRPIIMLAEILMQRVAGVGGSTPAAWWFAILTIGPLLGSFITEPAAMTISALLLARHFFDLKPDDRLKYATIGLLFVNVSIGGVLTHFAAPPVLMVARPWGWSTPFMLERFGWRAILAVIVSNGVYVALFHREFRKMARRVAPPDAERPDDDAEQGRAALVPVPFWIIVVHLSFMAWTVANARYPALFVGGFLFFLGFVRATAQHQSRVDLRSPLLVGFFLAGLVIHGSLQGWWIAPLLARLSERPLFFGAAALTAFNDNALITYLATLAPSFSDPLKLAVLSGAVAGGGLTVIANAPNPAGQALLARFFGGSVQPLRLAAAALIPTIITMIFLRL